MKTYVLRIFFIFALAMIFFFVLSVALVAGPQGKTDYPDYKNYVNDFAEILSQEFEDKTNADLAEYDKQTTNQIAVATIKTTGSESIEEYSIHLADKWKPGQEGKDNGLLMLI